MYIHAVATSWRSECSCIHAATHCTDIIVQFSEFLHVYNEMPCVVEPGQGYRGKTDARKPQHVPVNMSCSFAVSLSIHTM